MKHIAAALLLLVFVLGPSADLVCAQQSDSVKAGDTLINIQSMQLLPVGVNGDSLMRALQDVDFRFIPFKTISGHDTSLSAFEGKVVLIVNVASKCGFTPQYEGLEKLYEKYKDKGLVIVGFPANDFGGQEPGTNREIETFCRTNYGVTFPMMSKISVIGKDIHPLFKYLTEDSPIPGEIKWNFSKFLLDRSGKLVARYPSKVTPLDPQLTSKIESLF